jgi:hypothetical protein
MGVWHKYRDAWAGMNEYEELEDNTVRDFCISADAINRTNCHLPAMYKNTHQDLDQTLSMPKLGPGQEYLDILQSLRQESDPVIRRWETFYCKHSVVAFHSALNCQVYLEGCCRTHLWKQTIDNRTIAKVIQ